MKKMSKPAVSFTEILTLCAEGITGPTMRILKNKLESANTNLIPFETTYESAAIQSALFSIQALGKSVGEQEIFEQNIGLSKSDLEQIYEQYFAGKHKPARKYYDSIKNSAMDVCPYCGLTTKVNNLDHFLPKVYFPQFSVLPQNLVPSCGICNSDQKGSKYADQAEDQIIHPYLEKDHFFNDQWIFARYHEDTIGDTGVFEFFVAPPEKWDITDQKRALKHFSQFDLANRYSKAAGEELSGLMMVIERLQKYSLPLSEIVEVLFTPKIECRKFVNHWHTGMYQAMTEWLLRRRDQCSN
ncbi:MAG TPA: hypothetical protein PK129_02825 [Cellvibrionaceae bacterium]|nr:hypothetical protein [Cellvibrionaceae bacterium]